MRYFQQTIEQARIKNIKVLSDDTKRQEYDAYGSGGGPAGGRGGAGGFHHHGNVDVNEIFRRAFGGGGGMVSSPYEFF